MSVSKVLIEWSSTEFDYHGHDCCRFAAAVSEAVTGRNPMAKFDYDGKIEAYRLIKKHGSLDGVITSTLGQPIQIADAKDGDFGVLEMTNGKLLAGAVLKEKIVVKTEDRGIAFFPLKEAFSLWSVSCQD